MSERVHEDLFATKPNADRWLELAQHRAQLRGLKTNATLLYGHVEQTPEKVEHFVRLREVQDETGGFLTFDSALVASRKNRAGTHRAHRRASKTCEKSPWRD